MNTKTFDIRRNRLADALLLLIEAAEKNTASLRVSEAQSDAAEGKDQNQSPGLSVVNDSRNGRVRQTEMRQC